MKISNNILSLLPKNAGTHNSIYRGEDITDLFYDGTLSKQISAGTFDDIWVGDYIIGKESKRKYLVADLDYRYETGDTRLLTHHILVVPEKTMTPIRMNPSNDNTGGYVNSEMRTTNLKSDKKVIIDDFGENHILTHRNRFVNEITNGYPSGDAWYNSDIDLMNECMVYGCHILSPMTHNQGTSVVTVPLNQTIDKSQLSLFRLQPRYIVASNQDNVRLAWWLRDISCSSKFTTVTNSGISSDTFSGASTACIRPAFLVY